jgi:hypothetical protein
MEREETDAMSDKKPASRNVANAHATDHMTVKHIQTELAAPKTEIRPEDYSIRHMTTGHISEALNTGGYSGNGMTD